MTHATPSPVTGLHHVTAISGAAARNRAFHQGVLGQRLVKRTVNFDDPGTWHLYYGNAAGAAGSVLTFFPWDRAPKGAPGAGQTTLTQFAVPPGALPFWRDRLAAHLLTPEEEVLGQRRMVLADPDGLRLALVETDAPHAAPWTTQDTPADVALRGFHGVTLALHEGESTARILTHALGYAETARDPARNLIRFENPAGPAPIVDLHVDPALPRGREGVGTVHHVAFSVPDRAAQDRARAALIALGLAVTPRIDRQYFHAIYTRTPGGVLFEVATEEPGFATDEPPEALGEALKLPPQYEAHRAQIEAVLPPL